MTYSRLLGERYTPLYFLNALIAGGFALSAYMYLYWLCKAEFSTLPNYNVLYTLFTSRGIVMPIFAGLFIAGFLGFSVMHVRLLVWNWHNFKVWRTMVPYKALMASKDKTVLLTVPATLSVSLMLALAVGAMAFPPSFMLKDYLLLLAFASASYISWRSIRLYTGFVASRLSEQETAPAFGSNLGQLMSLFAFTLLALPFALIAQNTTQKFVLVLSLFVAILLFVVALAIAIAKFLPHVQNLSSGLLPAETTPLFWFASGILSILSILYFQIDGGLARAFGSSQSPSSILVVSALLVGFGGALILIGKEMMKRHALLTPLMEGKLYSPGLYGVLCPTLGFGLVYGYLLNIVLMRADVVSSFSLGHFVGYLPLIALHAWAIRALIRLNAKLLGERSATAPAKPK